MNSRTSCRIPCLILLVALSLSLRVPSVPAQTVLMPSFGEGKITARMYTDYFCGPCRAAEPRIEPLLADLVKRNVIKITFIDTPVHRQTTLYANYFLYILNMKKDFDHVLWARTALFEAAGNKIEDTERLEEFLKKKGIGFKPFNVKPTLAAMNKCISEDAIKGTPACVINSGGQKQVFSGGDTIVRALELLR